MCNHVNEFLPNLQQISNSQQIPLKNLFQIYWVLILPFYQHIQQQLTNMQQPYMIKILGVPGVGKTAFGSIFQEISTFDGKTVGSVSTDDFYLPYEERLKLKEQDPRYITRGPPGTIDNQLLKNIIYGVKNQDQGIQLPYFDKSAKNGFGDRTKYIEFQKSIDIFILEGWFTGAKFQENEDILRQKLIEIGIKEESKLQFAILQNSMLKDYQDLWNQFNCQLILSPTDFKYMFHYRQEAENKLIKQKGSGLSEQQIYELMSYFYESLCPEVYVQELLSSKETDLIAMFDKQRNLLEVINHGNNM